MRVVLAHGPENNVREIRQALHSAGADCTPEDCVLWDDLPARLGQAEFDLVVVHAGEAGSVNWPSINEAKAFTAAPLLAIGPNGAGETEAAARRAGAAEYINFDSLGARLDDTLMRLVGSGDVRCDRGQVVAVHSTLGGSGGAFVALALGGHFARQGDNGGAVLELSAGRGKLGLMLDLHPEQELEDVCQRLHRIDKVALTRMLHKHDSGLRLLVQSSQKTADRFLTSDAVRRLIVLSRMAAKTTVLALGERLERPQIDALKISDRVVLVMRPDIPSLQRTEAAIEELGDLGIPKKRLAVAVNFWGRRGSLTKKHLEDSLHMDELFFVPVDDGRVNKAVNHGLLFQQKYPRSATGKSIAQMAKQLCVAPARGS